MANRILKQMYSLLYHEEFSYNDFSKRLKMQKGIYLLQELGIPVGDYRFSWYRHGPYSQSLLDDMYTIFSAENFTLIPDTEAAVKELSEALKVPSDSVYSAEDWAECLGSLHFLKENIFSFNTSDEELLLELKKRKPHLNDDNANGTALSRVEDLFS